MGTRQGESKREGEVLKNVAIQVGQVATTVLVSLPFFSSIPDFEPWQRRNERERESDIGKNTALLGEVEREREKGEERQEGSRESDRVKLPLFQLFFVPLTVFSRSETSRMRRPKRGW